MVKIEDHGNDVVSFEQEAVLEDNVVNVPSDVLVEEAEPPVEQDILDVPPDVDQANDYELTWFLTYRFRFSKPFAMNIDLSVLDEMTVETEDGFSMTLEIREETARGSIRYALRGWQNFMLQASLADGGQFDLRYNRNLNRLIISNHNF
ncbi:putative transcription factor B3-Domain family [Helianthus annuus]|nr:putative transcription factor B3-Domain family [Helianthus annuus]KAJ0870497.1 putative transcription factor B3-Domain family [Helianthus annuus]